MPKPNTQRASDLLASVTADMVSAGAVFQQTEAGLRVEKLILEIVRPHPVQPRRVLPEQIHQAFHQERLTPTQALRELIQIVQVAARQRSRPFANVLELLTDSEDEDTEKPVELSPEETLLRDLVNLAVTIRDDGQVNPLTVVDVSEGVSRLYRIETGERRYWATWLLRDFIPNSGSDGTIPAIIIPSKTASVFRQAKENTSRSGLTAVAMARQAALLLLVINGYEIPNYPVNNDFYRQSLELEMRGKGDHKETVLAAMGGISLTHFSRYKALLRLSDEAMEMADRHSIDEKKLRFVAAMPGDTHAELIRQIITFKLTSKQVEDICTGSSNHEDDDLTKLPPKALKFARSFQVLNDTSPQDVARALIQQEQDINLARARIQSMVQFLAATDDALGQIIR